METKDIEITIIDLLQPKVFPEPYASNNMEKHGTHDQKTHGNWAQGGASGVSNAELERAYEDFQGFTDESGYSALYAYTHNGFQAMNRLLREGNIPEEIGVEFRGKVPASLIEATEIDEDTSEQGQIEKIVDTTIMALDNAIDEAPQVLEDRIVYRVASVDALKNLKEGDVFTEKGFVSTTSVDITKNLELRENLGQIDKTTDDVVVKIYNGSHGKGLAVNEIQEDAANKNAFENEIILPRGRDFKYIGKDEDGNYLLERQN